MKSSNIEAYPPHLPQSITQDDFDRRVEYLECFVIRCEVEQNFPKRIIFTDSAYFKLNCHNSV